MSAGRKPPPNAQAQQRGTAQSPARTGGLPAGKGGVSGVLQPKAATPHARKTPAAPPAYRPQPVPKVLQAKKAPAHKSPARSTPAAPPVYRPEPKKIVQPKAATRATPAPRVTPSALPSRATQDAPPRAAQRPGLLQKPGVAQMPGVVQRKGTPPAALPRPQHPSPRVAALPASRPSVVQPWRSGVVQRKPPKWRTEQSTFLMDTTRTLFDATKEDDGKLMEVQSAIFDGRMFVASNYSRGADDTTLGGKMAATYSHGGVNYTGGTLIRLVDALHAEQQILKELAKILKNPNKANPSHVTVVGTKRPCSVCRRVLLAFNKALVRHYPAVHLHFVDQTGKDTDVDALDLSAMKGGADATFGEFADTYTAELANYMRIRLPGEDVSNGTRTAATPTLDDIL